MKNRISEFLIITLSLLCISCDFSIADLLNDKLELTPPIYLSYRTEYGKTPSRKPVQKGDVITEEMLPEVKYRSNGDNNNYFYIDGIRYYYDSEEEQTFDGWYYDELFLDKVEVGDVIEDNITIFGKWINTYVDISFSYNHGYLKSYYYYENNKEKNYRRQKIGTVLSKNNLPVITYDYDNYTFIGWYLDPYFETPAEGYVLESNITLYAKEKYNGYCTIHYTAPWSYYSDMPEKTSIQAGESLTSDYLPELYPYSGSENYEFMGWYYDYDCTQQAKVGDEVNTSITLYAKWVKKYARIFYSSGNTSNYADMPETKDVDINSTMLSDYLPNLTATSGYEEYIFVGWFYDWDCTREACIDDVITDDIWLYAKWEQKYVYIDYSYNYSIAELLERKKVEKGSTLVIDYMPELTPYSDYENYVFMGWYYDYEYTRQAQVGDEVNTDIWLYAKWEQKYVDIYYWSNYSFAELPESRKIEKGSTLVIDYMPELTPPSGYENYRFAGWYYDSEANAKAQIGDVIDINITLHAIWESKYITLYYETRGYADYIESKVLDNGSTLTADLLPELVPDSSYGNLVFVGWYYDSSYDRPAHIGDILNSENIWLYAKYDVIPNGTFLQYWVYDESLSDDYVLLSDLTTVYNPTIYEAPETLRYNYYYAGEEGFAYDSFYYDGVEYTNGSIIKKYYVKREISSNNLARLLSLYRAYDCVIDLTITDSNPDLEEMASILRNNNTMRCSINLWLGDCTQLTSIPENCFKDVLYMDSIRLPDSIQTIGKNAFKGCSDLESIHMYPSVTLIEEAAFEDSPLYSVYFRGNEEDRANMIINDLTILNAYWYYNW